MVENRVEHVPADEAAHQNVDDERRERLRVELVLLALAPNDLGADVHAGGDEHAERFDREARPPELERLGSEVRNERFGRHDAREL
jgi:hypothetical protein